MKILYYVGTGSNKFGGLEKFNIQLFKQLIAAHHEVVVIYRRPIIDGAFKNFLEEYNIKYRWIYESFAITGESKLTNAKRLASIVSEEKPDLIHYNFGNLYDMFFVRILNPFVRYKTIYTAHCHPNLSSIYLNAIFRCVSCLSNKILCVSNAICREFKTKLNSSKSQTLYLGVPDNRCDRANCRSTFGFANDEFIICNIAYHDPIKGVDILIKAVNYLKNELGASGFRVIQVGGSPFKEISSQLNELLDSVDISDCFEMWGLRNDIENILIASDVYCQTSRSEGIPLSMMEACMAQIPIVATNVGGVCEVAENNKNALLSSNEDYKAIAFNLKKLIDSTRLRKTMGEEGKRIALEKFDVASQASKLIDIYNQII
jgi:glycosyltransferase involved in cell wall biosynthesis